MVSTPRRELNKNTITMQPITTKTAIDSELVTTLRDTISAQKVLISSQEVLISSQRSLLLTSKKPIQMQAAKIALLKDKPTNLRVVYSKNLADKRLK